jgi:PAS domain S-box-containing protein
MATSTTLRHVLVVSDVPPPDAPASGLGFDDDTTSASVVSPDEDLRERLASAGADCLLVDVDPDESRSVLSTLRAAAPETPAVVFAADPDEEFVTATLDAGATDVVQSRLAATPPELVRHRVESAIDAGPPTRAREGRLYEGIVETTGVTAAVYDEQGRFVVANSRLAELYGTTPEALRGEPSHLLSTIRERAEEGDPFADLVAGRSGEFRTELELDYPTQEGRVTDVRLSRLAEDGEFLGVAAIGRDVTERRARERQIASQRDDLARLDRLNAVIRDVHQALVGARTREAIETAVCERLTAAGRYRFAIALRADGEGTLVPAAWTDGADGLIDAVLPLEEVTAETSPALRAHETGTTQVVERVADRPDSVPWRDPFLEAGIGSIATVPIVYGDTQYGAVTVCAGGEDAFDEREVAVLDELGETVGHAIAAAERREREETLTALYEATRELLGTETEGAVCDVAVDAASEALDLPEVGIFLFDGTENVLRPASATDELVAFYGGTDTFGPGRADSETWHAFATGETKVFDDISESERVANPDTEARSSFVRPLGEHGVFVAASTEVGAFDGSRRKLLGLLAATAETALDRVAGRADVREREQELADRSRRIERLSRVAALFEDVAGAVVRATTREEIERRVCERLIEENAVAFAWVGAVGPDGAALEPRDWAGDDGGYLDAVAVDGDEPAPRAAATGSTVTVGNVTDHLRDAQWARAAADRGYQSAVAVPLGYGETTYGVAAAYATEPHAFEGTAAALDELGDLVGFAINAAETRRGVLADRVTELELRLPGTDTFVNAVADLAGEPVQYLELAPAGDGRTDILFALEDADVEAVLGLQAEFVGVEVLDHVGDEERARFRATVTGRTVASTLLSSGAVPRRVVAHPDVTVAVVELPAQRDVRVVVDRVAETYPGVELVSRRDRAGRDRRDLRGVLETELTDRQREVLTAAYESGFFQSPRETTGAQLADLLGVSQPTITHHLREAQRRLFAAIFDDES